METRFSTRFLVPLIGGLALILGSGNGLAAEKARLGTPINIHALYNMPILAAQDKGFFKQEGVEEAFSPFTAAATMDRATAAGQIDMGIAPAGTAIIAAARGIDQIIVADLGGNDRWFFWVRQDSPIKEPKDLKGTRHAVVRFGSAAHAYSLLTIKSLGLEKDIKVVAAGGARENFAALKAGVVDSVIMTFMSTAPLKFRGEVRELVNVGDYLPKERSDATVFARRDYTRKQPEAVKKVIRALLQGASFVTRNRDWAVQKMKTEYGFPEELGRIVYEELLYPVRDARVDRKVIENTRDFLIKYELVSPERTPAADALYLTGFTP